MIAGEWRLRLTMLEVRVLLKREPSTMMVATCLDQPVNCKLKVIVLYNVTEYLYRVDQRSSPCEL